MNISSWIAKHLALIFLAPSLGNAVREWDVARNLEMSKEPLGTADRDLNADLGSGMMAQQRQTSHRITFQTLGRIFYFDVDYTSAFIAGGLNKETSSRSAAGRTLKVVEADGTINIVNDPLARFMIRQSQDNQLQVTGGFQYDGHFYRLTDRDNVFLQQQVGGDLGEGNKLIVTRKEIGKLNEHQHGGSYKCGAENLNFNKRQAGSNKAFLGSKKPEQKTPNLQPGQVLKVPGKAQSNAIRDAKASCPIKPHQLTIAVVADCNYVKALGGRKKARENILNDVNLVSGIFSKTYNIDLSINSVELLDKCEKGDSFNVLCKDYPGLDVALNRFSKWRDQRNEDAGVYHLVTSCNYSETVGLAWVNQVCRTTSFTDSQADIVSGTSMSVLVENQFSVMAHELSHNLGAIHDCTASNCDGTCKGGLECQCCPCDDCDCKGRYIMDPENKGFGAVEFSACTIKDVCDKLPYIGSCIREQKGKAIDLVASCGNGIREGEEECDCGTPEQCTKQKCCTENCKLTQGSQCSDANDGCCRDCQIIPANSREVCRVGTDVCQDDAICDGKSSICPPAGNKADGMACSDEGKCASGICTSRDLQCSIFGRHLSVKNSCPYTRRSCSAICESDDQCVDLNANFVDGTQCGDKGYCYNGMCSEFGSDAPPRVDFSWTIITVKAIISVAAFIVGML